MSPFSIWRDGLRSTGLSRKLVAETGWDASSLGSAVTGWAWEYFEGT